MTPADLVMYMRSYLDRMYIAGAITREQYYERVQYLQRYIKTWETGKEMENDKLQ